MLLKTSKRESVNCFWKKGRDVFWENFQMKEGLLGTNINVFVNF